MKKILFALAAVGCLALPLHSQESKLRSKYMNVGYGVQTLKGGISEKGKLTSDYAASFTIGKTFYLHKTPLFNMLRFGIDWTFFDLNFAGYSENYNSEDYYDYDDYYNNGDYFDEMEETEKSKSYQLEAAMQVGPSVTLTPIKDFSINAYFRYAPSFTGIYSDINEDFAIGYGSFFVAGAAVSYKMISLGIENRWGSNKYKFSGEEAYDPETREYYEVSEKIKLKTSDLRFYVSLRF